MLPSIIPKQLIAALAANSGALAPVQDKPVEPAAPPPAAQQPSASYFNPAMSIVGDFAVRLMDDSGEGRHADFRHVEFGFAADADPHLRVELYAAFEKGHEEEGEGPAAEEEIHFELEEAFGTYRNVGGGFQAKFGKFAGAIGRVQRNHLDQLNYMQYPLVIEDVLGDHGLRAVGVSLSYLFPTERFTELTLEVLDVGDEGPVFSDSSAKKPLWLVHGRTFFDFSEDMSAQLGATYANGPMRDADGQSDIFGIDYTMKWQPGAAGRSAVFEAEAMWTKLAGGSDRAFGMFARLEYEALPRWFLTVGYDHSEVPGSAETRRGLLAGVTHRVTEFHHWRLEFQRISSNMSDDVNLLSLQFQWLIGKHQAHKY